MKRLRTPPALAPALGLGLLWLAGCAGSTSEPAPDEPVDSGSRPVEASVTYAAVGKTAPDFELDWLNHEGGDTLADLKGRVVLLEFWRTW